MTLIELLATLHTECGASGAEPTTVAGVTGEDARLLRWIKQSWGLIQIDKPEWRWMWGQATVNTVASDNDYLPAAFATGGRFRSWRQQFGKIFETALGAADETRLVYAPYEDFFNRYMVGVPATPGRPLHFTVAENNTVLLGPTPDRVYTVTLGMHKSNQTLVADGDIPEFHVDFHYAIVYRAMMMYARFESAPEIYDDSGEDFRMMMARLAIEELETMESMSEAIVE